MAGCVQGDRVCLSSKPLYPEPALPKMARCLLQMWLGKPWATLMLVQHKGQAPSRGGIAPADLHNMAWPQGSPQAHAACEGYCWGSATQGQQDGPRHRGCLLTSNVWQKSPAAQIFRATRVPVGSALGTMHIVLSTCAHNMTMHARQRQPVTPAAMPCSRSSKVIDPAESESCLG